MSGFSGTTEGGVLHGYDVINNLTSITSNGSVTSESFDLPNGFTTNNTIIISIGYSTNQSDYRYGDNALGDNERIFARISNNNKYTLTTNYNGTIYVKITFLKIS